MIQPSRPPGRGAQVWLPPVFTERSIADRIAGPSGWFWLVGLSGVIGLACSRFGTIATLHQAIVLLAVIVMGLVSKKPAPLLVVITYAGTSDVLWRMGEARGPWEGSKYALVFGFGCLAFRLVRRPPKPALPITLLLLLIPGVLVGVARLGPSVAREYLVANLAGLIALGLGVLGCSGIRATQADMRGLFMVALSPVISVAIVAQAVTRETQDLEFGDTSNFAGAGGFGPNQVSSLLGFGALLCVLIVLQKTCTWRERVFALIVATGLIAQGMLTFSRGGIYSFAIAGAAIGVVALTQNGQRSRAVVVALCVGLVGIQVLAWAGAFTGGASEERFSNTDSSNRLDIASGDIELFTANPMLGVGVGMAKFDRDFSVEAAPHTEYTRLLAEHGVFGLVAVALIIALSVRLARQSKGWYRMMSVGLVVMTLAQMSHSATRTGCIALGFAFAALREDGVSSR